MKIYLVIFIILLAGCEGPYADLEKKYPKENDTSAKLLKPKRLILTSQHHKGAFSFTEMSNIQLTDNAVFISLNSFLYEPVEIPISSVTGCECTWFGKNNWDTDLILGADGVEISIHLSNETKDWCYENNLPIIPGKQKRDWLYNKVSLPSYDDYEQVDKETFDKQFKRACMGF